MTVAMFNLIIGFILLLLGRKLFWLFVGAAGFLMGLEITNRIFITAGMTKLAMAAVIGLAGVLLAIFFYKAAITVAGFLIGGYLAIQLVLYLTVVTPSWTLLVAWLVGGVLGVVLINRLFDWALIVLSSFSGAALIVQSVTLRHINMAIVYIVLVAIGILVQAGLWRHSHAAGR